MESFTISDLTITFRGDQYQYEGYQKLDSKCVHIMVVGCVFCFLGELTEINGELKNTADEIIAALPVLPNYEN